MASSLSLLVSTSHRFILLCCCFISLARTAHAQVTKLILDDEFIYDTYKMDGTENREYRLAVSEAGVLIEARHLVDLFYSFSAIRIRPEDHAKFIVALAVARQKYVEWSRAAPANSITSLEKVIDVDCPSVTVIWNHAIGAQGTDVSFHNREMVRDVRLKFEFIVSKGVTMLGIHTGPLQAKNGTSSRDVILCFDDIFYLNKFIGALSLENTKQGRKRQREQDALFK